MKIILISPQATHLASMSAALGLAHDVLTLEGGMGQMLAAADQQGSDLMIVEDICDDPAQLAQLAQLTARHTDLAVILLRAASSAEFLLQAMRAGVREVLPSPLLPGALEAAVGRIQAKLPQRPAARGGKLLAFLPCKGGSGATFIASNLGYQLAERRSVLLLDLNLQFGDALSFVSEGPAASSLADVARDISRLDAAFLASSCVKVAPNYSVLAAPEDLTQAMEIKLEHVDAVIALALAHHDFVLLDLPRQLDTLAIKALDRAHRIYPVLQAGVPGVRNARKLLNVFHSLGYPASKTEMIVNRFERGGDVGLEEIERSLSGTSVRTVPNAYREVNAAINQGNALLQSTRSSAVTKSLAELATSLMPKTEEAPGLLERLFKRDRAFMPGATRPAT